MATGISPTTSRPASRIIDCNLCRRLCACFNAYLSAVGSHESFTASWYSPLSRSINGHERPSPWFCRLRRALGSAQRTAGHESLVGVIEVGQGKILLVNRNALLATQLETFLRVSRSCSIARWSPDLTPTHDEEVRCVAGADKPWISSISASSAPAFSACVSAITSCSLLWQLRRVV